MGARLPAHDEVGLCGVEEDVKGGLRGADEERGEGGAPPG